MKNSMASNGIITAYTYDLVGNVTQVTSVCPWLQNQSFTENFSYDSTDQLTAAQESQNNGYQLVVNYDNWGKIMQYDIAQTDMLNNATETHSRSYAYPTANYSHAQTSFAPIMQTGDEQMSLSYGINGSLRKKETTQPQQHTEYYLFNSQSNLKAYSDDVMSFAYYGYNAANTRTYKLSLYNTNLWINGQQEPLNMQLQQAMFYPNTYLNFNGNGEYTKHYYNGTERIASRLGDNTTTIALNNNILEDRKLSLEEHFREDIHKLIYETVPIDMPPFMDVNTLQPTGTPNDIYYYHPNHLGNTAFITDDNATITQGFLYAPFGEITTEYNINFGNNTIPKYSFNAKELDEETGMYYYEARYYKPPVFTSRDAMFEKYFWMSPYAYCANNPVKYVDPDGREIGPIWPRKGVNTYSCKLKAGVGIGFGVSISGMTGISFDSHGMTHWTAYNSKYITNQNLYECSLHPAIECGIDLSLSGNFERNSNYDNFIESIKSSSVTINFEGKAIVGGSLGIGDDSFSIGLGIGVSIGASSDPYVITESISLSKSEAKKIGYFSMWTVVDQKYDSSTNTYQGVVQSNGEKTNVKVYCSPTELNGVHKPDGMWSSTDYWSK